MVAACTLQNLACSQMCKRRTHLGWHWANMQEYAPLEPTPRCALATVITSGWLCQVQPTAIHLACELQAERPTCPPPDTPDTLPASELPSTSRCGGNGSGNEPAPQRPKPAGGAPRSIPRCSITSALRVKLPAGLQHHRARSGWTSWVEMLDYAFVYAKQAQCMRGSLNAWLAPGIQPRSQVQALERHSKQVGLTEDSKHKHDIP